MKKAYVILAHRQPAQLLRLVQTLNDGASVFFVHIDRRSDINQFGQLKDQGVVFVPRVKTAWANFGLVEAALNGLRAVLQSKEEISHVILLSGQDYPIKTNDHINRFIRESANKSFIEYFPLPCDEKWQPDGGLYRVSKYFFGFRQYQRYGAKAANFVSGILPFMRRKSYQGMKAYAGSMWWIINREAAQYILDFVKKNPHYAAFHRFTFAADEVFFHMILLNAQNENLSSVLVNTDKHFIKWKGKDSSHPELIDNNDLEDLMQSDALFARKLDLDRNKEVFDLIDKYCLDKNPTAG